MPTSQTRFTDYEVACAFNSCFDLNKFKSLHARIRTRAIDLLKHHRLKPVCFFKDCGFGLRVYNDLKTVSIVTDGDEATVDPKSADGAAMYTGMVDVDGYWVRCPGEEWDKKKPSGPKLIVLDKSARKYLTEFNATVETQQEYETNPWSTVRKDAWLLDKEAAERAAEKFKGIVIPADEDDLNR